jgi:protein-S-isoprenylcysteine O-methyltransferase Ste14
MVRIGGWLFRHRTWLPIPIAVALLVLPRSGTSAALIWLGVAVTSAGEGLRLLAVREIGVISRTRSDRLGPLVASGPFAFTRNPLYLGNIAIWLGFAISSRVLWLVVPVAILLGLEYEAIVRWEERLLESRLGDSYRTYAFRVPRWVPRSFVSSGMRGPHAPNRSAWRETLFSERGTLIAIAAGYALLWLKEGLKFEV